MTSQGMIMQLMLGRADPYTTTCRWGFDAEPITGVSFVRSAQLSTLTVGFVSQQALAVAMSYTGWKIWDELILKVSLHDDLIRCAGGYYCHFEIFPASSTLIPSLGPDSS